MKYSTDIINAKVCEDIINMYVENVNVRLGLGANENRKIQQHGFFSSSTIAQSNN